MERIDLNELKKSLKIKDILNELGITYKTRRNGTELMLRCIDENHQDSSGDSLHMNARGDQWNGVYKCAACGVKGDFIGFLKKATDNSYRQIIDFLKGHGHTVSLDGLKAVTQRRTRRVEQQSTIHEIEFEYTLFGGGIEWGDHPAEQYLRSRNIRYDVATHHKFGYSNLFKFNDKFSAPNAIVFPVFYHTAKVAYFLRCWQGTFYKTTSKLFPPNSQTSLVPWNYDQCLTGVPVILVEGIIDAAVVLSAIREEGLCYDVMSTYSNSLSPSMIELIRQLPCEEIIVMPDRDSLAGTVLCDNIGSNLLHDKKISTAYIPTGQDPAETQYHDIVTAIERRFDWQQHITENLIRYGVKYRLEDE